MSIYRAESLSIGQVVRDAAVFDPKRWLMDAQQADSLPQAVADLFRLLYERRIDYVLVGGVAMLQYIEGRNTQDIDLVMALASLQRLPEIVVEHQDADFARGRFGNLRIDILLTRNPLFRKVQRRFSSSRRFAEQDIRCATAEGLLLLKLYALPSLYRQGQFSRVSIYETDIATLMHDYGPDMETILAELTDHLPASDLAAVREIVVEINARITRFTAYQPQTSSEAIP
jgi:hypothetical protein